MHFVTSAYSSQHEFSMLNTHDLNHNASADFLPSDMIRTGYHKDWNIGWFQSKTPQAPNRNKKVISVLNNITELSSPSMLTADWKIT